MKNLPFAGDPDFVYLDDEERELIETIEAAYEEGKMLPLVGDEFEQQLLKAQIMATNTFAKTERVNIRISRSTLSSVKEQAQKLGLPYQTHIASVLHQYATGQLRAFSHHVDT